MVRYGGKYPEEPFFQMLKTGAHQKYSPKKIRAIHYNGELLYICE
jgi:hypothetical protein